MDKDNTYNELSCYICNIGTFIVNKNLMYREYLYVSIMSGNYAFAATEHVVLIFQFRTVK